MAGLFEGLKRSPVTKCVYLIEHSHYESTLSAKAFLDYTEANRYFDKKAIGFTHKASNKEEAIGDGIVELKSRHKNHGEVVVFKKVSLQ